MGFLEKVIDFPGRKKSTVQENFIRLSWDTWRYNFGDILNPLITGAFSSKPIKRISSRHFGKYEHYFVIGSILQRSTDKTIVWGSGFISDDASCRQAPKKIHAVRGPLTRAKLLAQGIECPEVYGDPALLLPRIYSPEAPDRKFRLGIVPHYKDKSCNWLKKNHQFCIKIIDVLDKNTLRFVDEINS